MNINNNNKFQNDEFSEIRSKKKYAYLLDKEYLYFTTSPLYTSRKTLLSNGLQHHDP